MRLEDGVVAFRHPLVRAAALSRCRRRRATAGARRPGGRHARGVPRRAGVAPRRVHGGRGRRGRRGARRRGRAGGRRGATAARAHALARAAAPDDGSRRALPSPARRRSGCVRRRAGDWAQALVDEADGLAGDERQRADAAYVALAERGRPMGGLYPDYVAAVDAVAPVDPPRCADAALPRATISTAQRASTSRCLRSSVAWALLDEQLVPGLLGVPTDVAALDPTGGGACPPGGRAALPCLRPRPRPALRRRGRPVRPRLHGRGARLRRGIPRAQGTLDALVERTRTQGILPRATASPSSRAASTSCGRGRLDDAHATMLRGLRARRGARQLAEPSPERRCWP